MNFILITLFHHSYYSAMIDGTRILDCPFGGCSCSGANLALVFLDDIPHSGIQIVSVVVLLEFQRLGSFIIVIVAWMRFIHRNGGSYKMRLNYWDGFFLIWGIAFFEGGFTQRIGIAIEFYLLCLVWFVLWILELFLLIIFAVIVLFLAYSADWIIVVICLFADAA